PKPPQNAEFSASQGLNIKAILCSHGSPFQEVATMRVCPCETPTGWLKSDLYCVIDINNRTTIICNQCLA
ncbi:hypothetical protein CWC14_18315, partial [Pseudoalteromonas sp. S3260]|uniref:hypothetical protein n=1 Tax=Pseudoalteromonas sp. S3260 TaxID=579534 RepID=UPI00127F3382